MVQTKPECFAITHELALFPNIKLWYIIFPTFFFRIQQDRSNRHRPVWLDESFFFFFQVVWKFVCIFHADNRYAEKVMKRSTSNQESAVIAPHKMSMETFRALPKPQPPPALPSDQKREVAGTMPRVGILKQPSNKSIIRAVSPPPMFVRNTEKTQIVATSTSCRMGTDQRISAAVACSLPNCGGITTSTSSTTMSGVPDGDGKNGYNSSCQQCLAERAAAMSSAAGSPTTSPLNTMSSSKIGIVTRTPKHSVLTAHLS